MKICTTSVVTFVQIAATLEAAPPQYLVTDLGPAGSSTQSGTINSFGQVAGSVSDINSRAVIWNGSFPTFLGAPSGGTQSAAGGNNNVGQVVGLAFSLSNTVSRAVLWNGTTPTDLGAGAAFQINDSGQIAGILIGTTRAGAVRWDGTTPIELNSPAGTSSAAYGINSAGQVIGHIIGADEVYHATVWTGTTPTILGSLGGLTLAYGINEAGQVAGLSDIAAGETHAVLWTGTTPLDLGLLAPGGYSTASAVNSFGDVVGLASSVSYDMEDPLYNGFIYTGGTMYNLNSFLLTDMDVLVVGANGINDAGMIAAYGMIEGQRHALLLTPTPEPGSIALLLCGAVLLNFRRRRNEQNGRNA